LRYSLRMFSHSLRVAFALPFFTLLSCASPESLRTPQNSASVPKGFFDAPLVFATSLVRGPGYEAIVLPSLDATARIEQDRIRITKARSASATTSPAASQSKARYQAWARCASPKLAERAAARRR
jgi:hypothetical protein